MISSKMRGAASVILALGCAFMAVIIICSCNRNPADKINFPQILVGRIYIDDGERGSSLQFKVFDARGNLAKNIYEIGGKAVANGPMLFLDCGAQPDHTRAKAPAFLEIQLTDLKTSNTVIYPRIPIDLSAPYLGLSRATIYKTAHGPDINLGCYTPISNSEKYVKFDSAKWQEESFTYKRKTMLPDLLMTHDLGGMTEAEMKALLGNSGPEKPIGDKSHHQKWHHSYRIGYSSLGYTYLRIMLDEQKRIQCIWLNGD